MHASEFEVSRERKVIPSGFITDQPIEVSS